MNFEHVFSILVTEFDQQQVSYALIGGFALGLYGVPRATVDLDFLIRREDIGKVDAILRGLAYERRYVSDNVSQYVSPLTIYGEIDILHAFRPPSLVMLDRARSHQLFNGRLSAKVAMPEDLIGLKVQALANNPERMAKDFSDICALVDELCPALDWAIISSYFALFNLYHLYDELRRRCDERK